MTTIAVVSAGLSEPSSTRLLADRLAAAVQREAQAEVRVINLREHAHDIADNLLTGFPPPALRTAIDTVVEADALIAVSPIFNASYSGLFKSFFDVLEPDSLAGKPVLLGATGGTARHSLALEHALRPMFAYLRATVAPTAVFAATEDWGGDDQGLADRVASAGRELADLVNGKPSRPRPNGFDDPIPFEQLLGRGELTRPAD
ncbi:FMN reductase [Actinokineospora xionganensis]|uniref:FMN reductase n=1 Tax=Actinokineospora xionganensis TaxID=2684470 RepID=A0ABR7LAT7_9PSEU|nr:FMN reductase [Actinokineospora xionganensis]MBC6449810.1 FMN reductase [Actinokineospora xionganensis]